MLMKGPLVRAVIEGRKTQTRRLVTRRNSMVTPDARGDLDLTRALRCSDAPSWRIGTRVSTPRVRVGDRLWVREAWRTRPCLDSVAPRHMVGPPPVQYAADGATNGRYRQAMHMPRWACRLVLEVRAVRAERLQDITEEDAKAEGAVPVMSNRFGSTHRDTFSLLWDSINAKPGTRWDDNPHVWVYEWTRIGDAP